MSLMQFYQTVFAGFSVEIALDGRSGGSQQSFGAMHRGQHNGCIAGMVARRRIVLLVARFVLFVHYYQSQLPERKENGRTNANDHLIAFIVQHIIPYLHTLGIREF